MLDVDIWGRAFFCLCFVTKQNETVQIFKMTFLNNIFSKTKQDQNGMVHLPASLYRSPHEWKMYNAAGNRDG